MLPKFDVLCGSDAYFSSEMIADATQPGCEKQSKLRRTFVGKFKPSRKLLSAKSVTDPNYPSNTIFEWKLWKANPTINNRFKKAYENRHFLRRPDFKAIFVWNEMENVCTPLRIVAFDKSGQELKCENLPHQPRRFEHLYTTGSAPSYATAPLSELDVEAGAPWSAVTHNLEFAHDRCLAWSKRYGAEFAPEKIPADTLFTQDREY
ncbi:hypothetical protein EPUL_002581 [Erysiphe pulchra]|uniref:Uncharacterized protein n=1 Tax=Erysiphe pulchra TaxID=225359 RepID=A0A2S4Q0G1_9PEZI|nr:hypothetical protein EPUL_002581 [Erysiphe pulchra]